MTMREDLKTALRDRLNTYEGDVKQPDVKDIIEQLCQLNPVVAPTHSKHLESQTWLLISAPSFPQGKKLESGKYAYTLGRLAFNMFEPTDLPLVIDCVQQPVVPLGDGEKRTHDIVVKFTLIDETLPPLKGIVRNLGICYPIDDHILQVKFTGGILAPQEGEDLASWKQLFSTQRSPKKGLKEKLMSIGLKWLFGLVPPTEMNPTTGELSFEMKRSPKGHLEVLYLDEELRITRGEKGTILVCEQAK